MAYMIDGINDSKIQIMYLMLLIFSQFVQRITFEMLKNKKALSLKRKVDIAKNWSKA